MSRHRVVMPVGLAPTMALSLALVVASAGCGGQSAQAGRQSASASASAKPSASASAHSRGDVAQEASRLEALCRARFGELYAGLEVAGGQLVVYRKPSPGLDAAVNALRLAVRITYRDAPYSARELEAVRAEVERDIAFWRGRGIVISTVHVGPKGTAVEVGTPNADLARGAFARRYAGGPPVETTAVGPVVAVTPATR